MRYGALERFHSGVAVPLTAVRTRAQLGVGEFSDLPVLAQWAASIGLDLVQILPVQDTGSDASPYAARTAFGLHPLHLRLDELEGAERFAGELATVRRALAHAGELEYADVAGIKREFARRIFDRLDHARLWKELDPWIEANPWMRAHAVYAVMRERHGERPWRHWPQLRDPRENDLQRFWESRSNEILHQVWLQANADAQLRAASAEMDRIGVRLKGDLPILLDEDSSDVWYHRALFDLAGRAGAPPDMYAEHGQLWGFPTYRWDALAAEDFAWWKRRLRFASRYYHALRIDHVLGFFRIWRVPATSRTAMLGRFDPAVPISREELRARGFDDERIDVLASTEGRVGAQYPFEAEYASIDDPQERLALMRRLWNRVLLPIGDGGEGFRPYWYWFDTELFRSLPAHEQQALHALMGEDGVRQEELWARTGRQRLAMVEHATDALVCAEDLGAVPACVPGVLEELGMLGLRVERWMRAWNEPDRPFLPPSSFPRHTVCSPSVHDASSLRAWWEESADDRRAYWRAMGKGGEPPEHMDTALLTEVLARNLAANSALCILSMPDLLALDERLRPADPKQERINVPGTASEGNWRWRMTCEVEALASNEAINEPLRALVAERRARPLAGVLA